MRAVLLAAGLGTRLRPITAGTPKCLVPIHGRPLLDYWLDLLCGAGIEQILINTHHLAARVRDHVAASPWHAQVYLAHEPALLGTGGTLVANADYIGASPVLMAHADNLTTFDPRALIAAHAVRPPGCAMTMLTFRAQDPRACGIVEQDGCGIVHAFHEKVAHPPGDTANAAVYILEPEVVSYTCALGLHVLDFQTQVIPAFLGRILAMPTTGYHRDIGTISSLDAAHREFPPPARAARANAAQHFGTKK